MYASTTLAAANPALAGHIAGYVFLLAGIYLVFAWPRRVTDWRMARTGQLAIGAFAAVTSIVGAAVAGISLTTTPHWFASDGMANPTTFLVLSMVLLTGTLLGLVGTQKLAVARANVGGLVSAIAWPMLVLDSLALGALWFGRSSAATWSASNADRDGALVLAGVTAAIATVAIISWIVLTVRYAAVRGTVVRALLLGTVAATQEAMLFVAHANSTAMLHINGADLLIAGCVIGVVTYVSGIFAEKAAVTTAAVTPARRPATAASEPARWEGIPAVTLLPSIEDRQVAGTREQQLAA